MSLCEQCSALHRGLLLQAAASLWHAHTTTGWYVHLTCETPVRCSRGCSRDTALQTIDTAFAITWINIHTAPFRKMTWRSV